MQQKNKIIYVLIAIIAILVIILIFRKPPAPTPESFDDSVLRKEIELKDSIANIYALEAKFWQQLANEAIVQADGLEVLKHEIHEGFKNQYDFNVHATNKQLDSVIRANW